MMKINWKNKWGHNSPELDRFLLMRLNLLKTDFYRDKDKENLGRDRFLHQIEGFRSKNSRSVSVDSKNRLQLRKDQILNVLSIKEKINMWITVVSIVVAFVMIIGGGSVTALASQGSLPGQSLWQVKTLSEDFLLLVENKPQESIQIQLKLIERRIEEARLMIGAGNEPAGELVRRLEGHMDRVMQGANFLGSEDLIKNLERVRETYQNQLRLYENFLGTGEMGNNSTAQQIRMLLQERIRLMEKCIEDPIQLQNWTRLQDRIRLQSKDSEWEDSQQNEYQEEFQSEYQYQYEYREHIQNGIDQQPVVPSGVQNEIQQQYEYQFQNQESNSELAPGNNADTSPDKADTDTGKNPQNKLDNGSGQDPENGNTDGESSPGSGQDSKSSDSGSGSQQSGQTGKKP